MGWVITPGQEIDNLISEDDNNQFLTIDWDGPMRREENAADAT